MVMNWETLENRPEIIFIVAPCILTTLMFLSLTNALLYYTYKMLKYTVKISHGPKHVEAIMRYFNCIFYYFIRVITKCICW